jgi:hypothetical protein
MIHRTLPLLAICVLVLLTALMSGCVAPAPPPSPEPEPEPVDPTTWPTWTFMVFLNGDNNLEGAAIDDFLEMAQVGSDDGVNIIVQMDRHNAWDSSYGDWDNTRRFVITAGDDPGMDPLMDLGEVNMGDPDVLTDFILWGLDKYKANHYILVIWNHGDGWRIQQQRVAEREATLRVEGEAFPGMKAVSWDDSNIDPSTGKDGDPLYLHEVGLALRHAYDATSITLDVVGFDACLMGMIEVAYEIKNYADFMVASEETEPGDGWPYDTILDDLVGLERVRDPENLAKVIVERYGEFYGPHGDETQAAYDLAEICSFTDRINHFVRTHELLSQQDKDWPEIGQARPDIEEFHDNCPNPRYCWGVDIGDFTVEVGGAVHSSTELLEVFLSLAMERKQFVIANFHGDQHPDASGVAFYFPPDHTSFLNDPQHPGYEDSNTDNPVAFVQDFRWDNWLREQYYAQFP